MIKAIQKSMRRRKIRKITNRPYPSSLTFFVTDRCNLKCRHCFHAKETEAPSDEMSVDEISLISESIDKCDHIILTGGEPFLRKDFVELCKVLESPTRILRICSNGALTDAIVPAIEQIVSFEYKQIFLQLSFDGTEVLHDLVRGPGVFAKALKTLQQVKMICDAIPNFYVEVALTITQENYTNVREFILFFLKYKVPIIFIPMRGSMHGVYDLDHEIIRVQTPRDKTLFPSAEMLEEVLNVVCDLEKKASYPFLRKRHRRLLEYAIAIMKNTSFFHQCFAGSVDGVMYPDGTISLCEMTQPISNVRDYANNFQAVWNCETAKIMRTKTTHCRCIHGCNICTSISLLENISNG